jgi:hypothetical protein
MPVSDLAERVRITIYSQLANAGTAPTKEAIGRSIGSSLSDVETALAELADAHHLVIHDHKVILAHPFATRSFRFSVMGADTLWWGGCAWDAFAIPNLVDNASPVLVATTCPACETPHAWTVTNGAPPAGDQVAHFLVPADRIWPDAAHACENQQIFCSDDCVTAWLDRTRQPRGYVMSLEQLWRLAEHWYDGRLSSPYERREPSQAADYFRAVGLRGPFWGLPQ